jgi:isopentenyl-diphosphate delta-isomerase
MELIDVLDFAGHPTGLTKPKKEIHRDGDWHRAAHLWLITPDDRVLLQRRALSKESWPGMWDISVAGHVDAGESAHDAIVRETFEELGLRITPADLTHLGTLRYVAVLNGGSYRENEFHEVYVVRHELDPAALVLDADEVAEVALVTAEELERYELVPHPESIALLRGVLR